MTREEFSNTFTTLLNSYGSIGNFGEQASQAQIVLDEYEKSVLLTQAQDIIVKSYYDRTMSPNGQGFDDSSRRQADFSSLITVEERTPISTYNGVLYDDRSIMFALPTNPGAGTPTVLLIIQEKLQHIINGSVSKEYIIKPISHEEYDRIMSKPYAKPLKKQAWRLFQNTATGFDIYSEIIPRTTISSGNWRYKVRYVRRPCPIILEDLSDTGLSIDGVTAATDCELNPIVHMDVLLKAVELAYTSHGGGVRNTRNDNE